MAISRNCSQLREAVTLLNVLGLGQLCQPTTVKLESVSNGHKLISGSGRSLGLQSYLRKLIGTQYCWCSLFTCTLCSLSFFSLFINPFTSAHRMENRAAYGAQIYRFQVQTPKRKHNQPVCICVCLSASLPSVTSVIFPYSRGMEAWHVNTRTARTGVGRTREREIMSYGDNLLGAYYSSYLITGW